LADQEDGAAWLGPSDGDAEHVADALVEMLPRDAIFGLRFLGESRVKLLEHFQNFIMAELAKAGATSETHPMLGAFAETHALALRDFVVSGVEVTHQFSFPHIERLSGDTSGLLRVDIWDQLKSHIGDAETQFKRQVDGLQAQLETYRARGVGGRP
jgi:hypothetical protein